MNLFSKGLLLIAIPCLFELALLTVLFAGQQDAVEAEQWASHSRDVMREADSILVDLLDESLRFRGSLLAQTPSLASDRYWNDLDLRIANLIAMVRDNPAQQQRAAALREFAQKYRHALEETLRQAQEGGEAAVVRRYRPGGGVVVLDQFRGRLAEFLSEEERLVHERQAAVFKARERQRYLLILVALGSLLAAAVGAYAFSRGIGKRVATLTVNAQRMVDGQALLPPIRGRDEIGHLDQVLRDTSRRLNEAEAVKLEFQRDLQRRSEQLAAVNADLRKQTEENEMFIYSVSHDLRSPLVNLQGFNQELRIAGDEIQKIVAAVGGQSPPLERLRSLIATDVVESLHYMDNAVQRAASIIDALLRLSRAGRVEYQPRVVDVGAAVQRVVDALHGTIASRKADVVIRTLPPVYADPAAVEQIFGNLVGNAVAYLDPERPGVVEVGALEADPKAGTVVFYVKDNGLGIPSAYLGKVFTAFQRLHGAVAPGEGIGLALVRRVVERHGGQVWVESIERQGTTFFLSLPVLPGAASA